MNQGSLLKQSGDAQRWGQSSGVRHESQTRRVDTRRMSSQKREERVEYLGEVSRTETGRRESVVRGQPKTTVTTTHQTTH